MLQQPNKSPNTPAVTTSSSSTQAYLLPSNSSIAITMSDPQPTIPVSNAVLSTTNNMSTPVGSSSVMSGSEIKMAPHGPQLSSHEEYTTDEEDMIVYDMGEERESPKNAST
ncbi:hypothetical protein TNCV_4075731 [Trichonephila clavipes]|nr:hypothetical protein TNCV_4075731 [Trichonephila clavipes]